MTEVSPARLVLEDAWGHSSEPVSLGWAPGRCTVVGEHVDYAGGVVVAIAINLGVEVAVRGAASGYRVVSAGRRVERSDTQPRGDIGDRILAAVEALRVRGFSFPGLDIGVSANLPESAGLSSSAAVVCATLLALLRHADATLGSDELFAAALYAERDVVGVPCGPLDQLTIVNAQPASAAILDCRDNSVTTVPWPWHDVAIVAAASGESHDVGGDGYRTRREQAAEVMRQLDLVDVQAVDLNIVEQLDEPLRRRGRHLVSETKRAQLAMLAFESGDAARLGELMSASHRSLRDDYEVSTARLDSIVGAALGVDGCWGARLCGAGFGGTAIALVKRDSAAACATAMAAAAGSDPRTSTWTFEPSAGMAALYPQNVVSR